MELASVKNYLLSLFNAKTGICLGFHSIANNPLSKLGVPKTVTSIGDFRSIMEQACRFGEPILPGVDSLPKKWFCVTFDDGFRDNMTNAIPVLESLGIPAIIFPVVDFVTRDSIPYEIALSKVVSQSALDQPTETKLLIEYETARIALKFQSQVNRQRFINSTRFQNLDIHGISELFLCQQELTELSRHPLIRIGSHGMSHVSLPHQNAEAQFREIVESRIFLEKFVDNPIEFFAFPYGESSAPVIRKVLRHGYKYAFTTKRRPIYGSRFPQTVPRFTLDGERNFPFDFLE